MSGIFGKGSDDLERELRVSAPRADAFVSELAESIERSTPPRRSRLAFASAVAVIVLGSFASFGGLGYAAEGAAGTADAVKSVVGKSSAADQYAPTQPVEPSEPQTQVAGATGSQSPSPSGTLPFTGLSLVGVAVVGGALLAVGFALRRRESRA